MVLTDYAIVTEDCNLFILIYRLQTPRDNVTWFGRSKLSGFPA